jgi:hypothetical protein
LCFGRPRTRPRSYSIIDTGPPFGGNSVACFRSLIAGDTVQGRISNSAIYRGTVAVLIGPISILSSVIIAAISVLLWRWSKSHALQRARGLARQVFPVWAAQGPFESGADSAAAMRYASIAVLGPEQAEGMGDAIAKHAAAYDGDPSSWEENRQTAIQATGPETANFVTIAQGLAAMDRLNKDTLEAGGHRLEYTRRSDGSLGLVQKKIWSDEAIEEQKKRNSETVAAAVGNDFLGDPSPEARSLVAFLAEAYETNTGLKAASASAIGRAWFACLSIKDERPESAFARKFDRLNEEHKALRRQP